MDEGLNLWQTGSVKGGNYRVAIATSDGIHVDAHFGQAEHFVIAEVRENASYAIVDTRGPFESGECGRHNEDLLQQRLAAVEDCSIVLATRIGQGIKRQLYLNNQTFFEIELPIERAMEKLLQYNAAGGVVKAEKYKTKQQGE